jgi:periplasmic protein TonB
MREPNEQEDDPVFELHDADGDHGKTNESAVFVADDPLEFRRWLSSGLIVSLVYMGLAIALVHRTAAIAPAEPAESVVTIELAPEPVAPAEQLTDIPPGPEEIQSPTPPDEKVKQDDQRDEKIEEKTEQKVEVEQSVQPDVVVSRPAPEHKPEPAKPKEKRPPAAATSKPQASRVRVAARSAAPSRETPVAGDSNAMPNWKSLVLGILQRGKRYPAEAQARHEQGVAQLAFSVDRQGRVVSSRIVGSSGSSALDAETLALVRRSSFPAPPPEMHGSQISLTASIRYNIR